MGAMSDDVADKLGKVAGPPGNLVTGVIKAIRPRQWVKNVLVAAAPLAAAGRGVRYDHTQVATEVQPDRKSTRLNSSHMSISYAVFCLKKKKHREHPKVDQQRTQSTQACRRP